MQLDGRPVERIGSDLTASRSDLTTARPLAEKKGIAFWAIPRAELSTSPDIARQWLQLPLNPNGRPNSDVLRPWMNGIDITRRPSGRWIIDFGWEMTEHEAALYEASFAYLVSHVRPVRLQNRCEAYSESWWRHVEPRPGMWRALGRARRYICTPRVAKRRLFAWLDPTNVPGSATIAIGRDDETTFGDLHSRFDEAWALRLGASLEDRPHYTPSTTFETFPFPEGLAPNVPAAGYAEDLRAVAVAEAARRLNELREAWLNPPDLVERAPEVVPGYPDRIVAVGPKAAAVLKTRTLTNLYNARPAWLDNAHRDLDAAVAVAYGWPAGLSEEETPARLLALNLKRAAAPR